MKKIIQSGLVVVITIISVYTMLTANKSDIYEEPVFFKDMDINYEGKPDGTGYLFDDFGRNINIPFEEQEEETTSDKKNDSSRLENERFKKLMERNMAKLDDETYSNVQNDSNVTKYESKDIRSESKQIIKKIQNNITLEDKLSLLKIVNNLSLKDLNDIKNAIINGTTNAESIKLWTMLRNKLPSDEYKELESIIAKYE